MHPGACLSSDFGMNGSLRTALQDADPAPTYVEILDIESRRPGLYEMRAKHFRSHAFLRGLSFRNIWWVRRRTKK